MQTIAVIFGGRSTEHDVSVVTAIGNIIRPLELAGSFTVVPIYIARDGAWYCDDKLKDIKLFSSGKIDTFLASSKPVAVRFDGGMTLIKSGRLGKSQELKIDVAFPATHGTYGEDGRLMGLLDMAGVPYVGCGQAASVLAMDKVLAKQIAQAYDINITKFQNFSRAQVLSDVASVVIDCAGLQYPLFVKPAHLGSSIGISRVKTAAELTNALEVAAHYDDSVLVEEAVSNLIEVTLPIMGNAEPKPALLEKPLTQAEDFFDFETKYMSGGKKSGGKSGPQGAKSAQGYSELPAKLPKALYDAAEATGLAVYKALGCTGIARVDMLIDSKTEQVYFNEVNPLPGSLYAHNWRAAGVSNVELVKQLVRLAEERHAAERSLATVFDTNYLQQF